MSAYLWSRLYFHLEATIDFHQSHLASATRCYQYVARKYFVTVFCFFYRHATLIIQTLRKHFSESFRHMLNNNRSRDFRPELF